MGTGKAVCGQGRMRAWAGGGCGGRQTDVDVGAGGRTLRLPAVEALALC